MRICDLKQKEVINVRDCSRLGFVSDVEFDICTGCLQSIVVPGPGCFLGLLCHEKEYVIPFSQICRIGDDLILVEYEEKKDS